MAGTQARIRQTLPTQSMAKAAAAMRGKRSGVIINPKKAEKGEMEDMDQLFDSAKTPDKTTAAALDESPEKAVIASTRKSRRKVKRPAEARMSLPGAPEDDDDESKSSAVKPSNYMPSVLAGKNVHFSPSALSHVSTAPPTPREKSEEEEEEEDVEETRAESLTQQEEEHVVSQTAKATTPQHSPGVAAASPDAFPVDDDHDDDDDEEDDQDLLPPNPPEHEDDQESVVQSVEEEPVAFPDGDDEEEVPEATAVADHEMENDDDSGDDDDDDDEGAGYNMVHDPETPHSVREKRKRKEREEMEKKQKKGKRGRPRKSQDSEAKTPARASKKTKKRNAVFSPQGYPIGNRDYTEVPVSDLIEPSPSDPNLRRSRRARTSPLNFWKNEKQVFGAHDEDGDIGEAMGDMPVVTKVLRALPTPYRKRTVTDNGRAKNSKRPGRPKTAASQPEESTPFDARKLRKKYNVIDGEMAQIWDAGADDIADMSTWKPAV
jgi:centromere protein C